MSQEIIFKRVVLAGGGCRSIWQAGFWHVAGNSLGLDKAVIGCVSAGAAMACLIRSDLITRGLSVFKENFRQNRRNMYLSHVGTRHPVFPQYAIYRQGMLAVLDKTAFQKIRQSPGIRILIARPPKSWNTHVATLLGFSIYAAEKHLMKPMHPTWSQKAGFQPQVITAESCTDTGQLADLVLQSSCSPPFLPVMFRDGQPALDGGLVDNVPALSVGNVQGPMLVLLSRRYPRNRIPSGNGRIYMQPSRSPPIKRWDYTNPEGIQETFDLGRRDGEAFLRKVKAGLFDLNP